MKNIHSTLKNLDSTNLIINSDHGIQYTSNSYKKILNQNNVQCLEYQHLLIIN